MTGLTLKHSKREIQRSIVFHYAGHSSFNEEPAGLLLRGKAPGEIAVLSSIPQPFDRLARSVLDLRRTLRMFHGCRSQWWICR